MEKRRAGTRPHFRTGWDGDARAGIEVLQPRRRIPRGPRLQPPPSQRHRSAAARQRALAALNTSTWRAPLVSVRINAPGTPWCHEDVIALATAPARPASLIVPKVEAAGDLVFVSRLLDGVERASGAPMPLALQ